MEKIEQVSLFSEQDSSGVKPTSLPLVLPNNVKYDPQTARVTHLPAVQRTHLEIVPSTVALLSRVREPIAVVSITGMARSGKSYVLSRILGSSDAFRLGHSMDPETFGIWIATQALKKDNFTIILVDTEGIDAASAEKKNDISLLVLTILLSSYFIFNTISVPKQAQLEDLECFVQLVSGLRVNREGHEDYNQFPTVFPDFLWLLRDVNLTPTDERGKEIDAKTFLTERLLKSSGGFEEKKSDKVARAIKMFFPSIDCVTLPVPSDDPEVMQHVETNQDKLSQTFNDTLDQVIKHILAKARPKAGYSRDTYVTGSQLACMLETYVNAVNAPDAIPVVETSWKTSLRILADRFHKEAVDIYKQGMTAALNDKGEEPIETDGDGENTLMGLHRKFYSLAQENVKTGLGPLCNELEQAKHMSRLQQTVFGSKERTSNTESASGLFHEFWRINFEKSISYCQRVRDRLYEPIGKRVSEEDKDYTYEHLKEDLKKFDVDYKERSKGPAKEKVYAEFMQFIKSEEKTFAKLENFRKEEFVEQQRSAEVSTKLEDLYGEQQRMEALMLEEMEENMKQAEKLRTEYTEKVDKMKEEEREAYVKQMSEETERMQQNMMANMSMLKEMADKNKQFFEDSVKMAQQERKQERKQMLDVVKAMQEKNARIAKEMAQKVKVKKSPLEEIGNFIGKVTSLVNVFTPMRKMGKIATATTKVPRK